MARASVLVVGDIMLDRYVYGTVSRISPEAPVPVLREERELAMPGGAGNVVRNLTALGAAVAFISVVGDDQAGSDLTALIGGQPNLTPWLLVQGGRCTTMKTRFVAHGQQLLRTDREEIAPVQPDLAERMLRIIGDAVAATSVTVLSDYRKGVLSGDVPARIIAAARKAGRPVVISTYGAADLGRFAGADVAVISVDALTEATGLGAPDDATLGEAARHLRDRHGWGTVVVNRGERGLTIVSEAGVSHLPCVATEIFDISGTFDTVAAALAAGIAAGLAMPLVAEIANLSMGVVLGRPGVAVARDVDLLAALAPQGRALRKVVTREVAVEQVGQWRQLGWRTGFTNGSFDPLLPEHRALLDQARAACDRLVVGVSTGDEADDSPVPLLAALAGLPTVDLVCLYREPGPEQTLKALQPELLVEPEQKPSPDIAALVASWGGKVLVRQGDAT